MHCEDSSGKSLICSPDLNKAACFNDVGKNTCKMCLLIVGSFDVTNGCKSVAEAEYSTITCNEKYNKNTCSSIITEE
jgi:hypothetical protein